MIDRRVVDRAQDAIRNVGRSGNLKEMAAARVRHGSLREGAYYIEAPIPHGMTQQPQTADFALAARLEREIEGDVLFDAGSRGRYSTDASIYQIEPVGVVVPRDKQDVAAALAIAREADVPVLPRGGGTSQCGQTVGRALVLDCSRYMNKLVSVDKAARRARVQPGLVLD